MQEMRQAAGFHKEVRVMPDMFPGSGIVRTDSRSNQGELVAGAEYDVVGSNS